MHTSTPPFLRRTLVTSQTSIETAQRYITIEHGEPWRRFIAKSYISNKSTIILLNCCQCRAFVAFNSIGTLYLQSKNFIYLKNDAFFPLTWVVSRVCGCFLSKLHLILKNKQETLPWAEKPGNLGKIITNFITFDDITLLNQLFVKEQIVSSGKLNFYANFKVVHQKLNWFSFELGSATFGLMWSQIFELKIQLCDDNHNFQVNGKIYSNEIANQTKQKSPNSIYDNEGKVKSKINN